MKLGCVLTICGTLFAFTVQAQEWVPIQRSETAMLGFDKANIRDTAEGRTAWTITVFNDTRQNEGDRFDYVVTRQLFDCDQERSKSQVARAFMIGGASPTFTINEDSPWDYHQPESIAGGLLAAVCDPDRLADSATWDTASQFAAEARQYLNE